MSTHIDQSPEVLIIGGGINGIGIARELAFRGVSVVLVEQHDLCSGTSSSSSKLVHGGIRYLEYGNFGLVAEACRERFFLTQTAPHLVSVQPFIIPIYKGDRRPPWMIRLGLWLYELMALGRHIGHNKMIPVSEALDAEPLLRKTGLTGTALYFDARMDDARLGIEIAAQACQMGAQIVTCAKAVPLDSTAKRIRIYGESIDQEITPKMVVNATGPWSDEWLKMIGHDGRPLLKPTKGIHLVTRPLVKTHALLITTRDNRIIFVIPHEEYSIVGTTDTPYSGSPDSVYATAEDIRYLISEVERVFETTLSGDDIYATFVGLRPLANTDQSTPGAISRDHQIVTHSSRLLSIVGGKYTTFRSMSEHMAKAVMERLGKPMRDSTVTIKLPMNKYPTNESRLADIPGSVRYAVQHEFARHVMDYMRRRTHAFFRKGNGLDIVDAVARELGEVLNWSQTQIAAESDHYREVVEAMHLEIRAAVK